MIGAASVYVGGVIGNIAGGKSGWDILKPTSSVGTYLGAAASGMITGGSLVSAVGRIVVNTGVKHVVDSKIKGTPINYGNVVNDLFINSAGEALSFGFGKFTNNIKPQNYSSFKHQLARRIPSITQKHATDIMYAIHSVINGVKAVFDFGINVATNR